MRATILPKNRALKLGLDQFVARVDTPRVFTSQRFHANSAAEDRVQEFGEEVAERLAAELQRRPDGSGGGTRIRGGMRV